MAGFDDVAALTTLLGRVPRADFDVVVRSESGQPVVVRNAPLTADGTPMPTRYWLADRALSAEVSRVELCVAHLAYAAERDAALPEGHIGPRPHGGVGGTRTGVKCLHAHYAYFLAGGDDPVGRWVAGVLASTPRTGRGEA